MLQAILLDGSEFQKFDVSGMTSNDVGALLSKLGGYFTRENYPFGRHNTYVLPAQRKLAMCYYGVLYLSPVKQLHPDVIANLKANWYPLSWEDQAWKRNNIGD